MPKRSREEGWSASRRNLVSVVVVLSALTTASCSGSEMASPEHALVIAEDAQSPPGTALGAGFVVERGSVLVGARFPLTRWENGTETGEGFKARMAVTREPYRTFRRYIDRAVRLGFHVTPVGTKQYCELIGPANDPDYMAGPDDDPPDLISCSATTPNQDPLDARPGQCDCEPKLYINLSYGRGVRGIPLAYITLYFHPAHKPERYARQPAGASPGPQGRVPTIRVRSDQRVPGAGGVLGRVCGRELRVGAESRVVARYVNGAVLEVTGDPATVFARYVKQVGSTPGEHRRLPEGEFWAKYGDGYHLTMVRTEHRTWLDAHIGEDSAC